MWNRGPQAHVPLGPWPSCPAVGERPGVPCPRPRALCILLMPMSSPRGFHNNNIKAIPEKAFLGNPLLQTM